MRSKLLPLQNDSLEKYFSEFDLSLLRQRRVRDLYFKS